MERRAAMYWYNPTTRTSERVEAPRTDEEAIEMLAADPQSVAFLSEYARLRRVSGMEIETALIVVGHEARLRHLGLVSWNGFATSPIDYDLLLDLVFRRYWTFE
jgi:hypothetical protein